MNGVSALATALRGSQMIHEDERFSIRLKEADYTNDRLERRITELADGKSIDEILDTVFSQEVRAGAWVVDIGIWRNLFDQSVVKTIGELAYQGYICLEPSIKEE